jgi:magnesium transporter
VHAATLEHLESKLGPLHQILSAEPYNDFWWFLDASNPTEEDVAALSEVFAIHPLTAEDMRLRETIEKIDLFPGYYFLSLRLPADSSNLRKPSSNLYALVFGHGALTVAFPESGQELNFDGQIMRLRNNSTLTGRSICLILM